MPKRTIEIMTCDLCHHEAERELPMKLQPPSDWLIFDTKNGADKREKIQVVICGQCVERIVELRAPKAAAPEGLINITDRS